MLFGRYEYTVDAKGRTNIPPKMRNELGETFYITKWLDGCIIGYGEKEWNRIAEILKEKSVVKTRDIQRMLYANAMDVTPDKQGRILLPQYLKNHANITKDIIIIGAGNHIEIWDKASYEEKENNMNFADIEAAMEAMGEVTGATVREDITTRIFERFCVGK